MSDYRDHPRARRSHTSPQECSRCVVPECACWCHVSPTELVITRGLPASGKTTYARGWVDADPDNRARVNRDDLRGNLFGLERLPWSLEEAVSIAQQAAVEALLRAGQSVIVDDTNLKLKHARAWADLAVLVGVEFQVVDFDTDADECARRDVQRNLQGDRWVGTAVIDNFAARYRIPWPEVVPTESGSPASPELYVDNDRLQQALIVDIDGTIATNDGKRGWYEWAAVGGDLPKKDVVDLVRLLSEDYAILLMSGRDEVCRDVTEDWAQRHNVPFDHLFMRPEGDNRRDDIVKAELFDKHVRGRWSVKAVLDDRDQVVKMWRHMGLTCLQVDYGNF